MSVTSPPEALSLWPTTMHQEPERPPVELPVPSSIQPLFPEVDIPDDASTLPDTPRERTFAVLKLTRPEPADVLAPLLTTTAPPRPWIPVAAPPETRTEPPTLDDADDDVPPSTTTSPALPLLLVPTVTLMEPPRPHVDDPVVNTSQPLFPDDDDPLLTSADPDVPDEATTPLPSDTDPEEELTLAPLRRLMPPPVPPVP